MVNDLEEVFPRLHPGGYQVTSPKAKHYNCIAWAAGDDLKWWWPVSDSRFYWPPGVKREETPVAFVEAFAFLGYVVCENAEHEPGFEKIALFAEADLFPRHAARQLLNGRWTSKLGEREDIEHELHDLEGEMYGTAIRFLKRPRRAEDGE